MLNNNEFYHGYQIIKYLGSGKSAYSYLVKKDDAFFVLKQMHLKPFVNGHIFKVKDELSSYYKLLELGIQVPTLITYDEDEQYLIKSYVDGVNLTDLIKDNQIPIMIYHAFYLIIQNIESMGYTIDYFPTNFILNQGRLIYVDYEINPYEEDWNFENWGVHFWFNSIGFNRYFPNHDMDKLEDPNRPGHPLKALTKIQVTKFYQSISNYNFKHLSKMLSLDIETLVIHQIIHGMAATSFEIKDDQNRYFVKYYPSSSDLDDIKSEIKASISPITSAPKLIFSDITKTHFHDYVVVFEYIDGEVFMDRLSKANKETKDTYIEIFTKTAYEIHQHHVDGLTCDFIDLEIKEINTLIQNNNILGLSPVMAYLLNNKDHIHQYQLSRIHGDYHPWNIMSNEKDLWVIDWKYKSGDYRYDVYWTYTLLIRSGFESLAKQFLNIYKDLNPNVINDKTYFIILSSTRWLVNVMASMKHTKIDPSQMDMFKSFIKAYSDLVLSLIDINLSIV
jgi:TP53 regulating kinase and related kinases